MQYRSKEFYFIRDVSGWVEKFAIGTKHLIIDLIKISITGRNVLFAMLLGFGLIVGAVFLAEMIKG